MAADGGYRAKNGASSSSNPKFKGDGAALGDDFPMLCETCLGQNPYVRMVKLPFGHKLCKISNVPYQSFRWKAGPQGRHKETIISHEVAAHRNICQACLNDMKYGLPVGVRDAMLQQEESQKLMAPQSNVGSQYFYTQVVPYAEPNSASANFALDVANQNASTQMTAFSQSMYRPKPPSTGGGGGAFSSSSSSSSSASPWASQPTQDNNFKSTAFRNLPKLCSFWLNGTCNRVLRKTCPFRPCCGAFVFPEIAGSDKEACAKLVADLQESGPAAVMKTLDSTLRNAIHKALKGNKDDAIRARVSGEDDLSKKYLNRMKSMNAELEAPSDPTIKTLFLGNLDYNMGLTREQLYDMLYSYGHIINIQCFPGGGYAFVDFASREQAEVAAKGMANALYIQGRKVIVNWAKPKPIGNNTNSNNSAVSVNAEGVESIPMPAPPGLEMAPTSAYSLPSMSIPLIPAPATSRPPPPSAPHPASTAVASADDTSAGAGKRKADDSVNSEPSVADGEADGAQHKRKALPASVSGSGPVSYPSADPNRLGSVN